MLNKSPIFKNLPCVDRLTDVGSKSLLAKSDNNCSWYAWVDSHQYLSVDDVVINHGGVDILCSCLGLSGGL